MYSSIRTTCGYFVTCILDQVRSNKENLPNWRKHSTNKRFIINDLQLLAIFVDKVTQFYRRPPEIQPTIDMKEKYHRWFYIIMNKNLKSDQMNTGN